MLRLAFDRGTLTLEGADSDDGSTEAVPPAMVFDRRVRCWRAPALRYREVLRHLHRSGHPFEDRARRYQELQLAQRWKRQPYPHQAEAAEAWWTSGRRGVVVLPTGAGKTHLAVMLIARLQRSALIVTPTLDLMQQWLSVMSEAFGTDIGLVGGGEHNPQPITVTTYDSAHLHMDRFGDRFGLLVFDECHHLPSPSYAFAAEASIAPFRLGLTATPEREDGAEVRAEALIGPIVYRREIGELAGEYLADYDTITLAVSLGEAERDEYAETRAVYRDFVSRQGIRLGSPGGWNQFLMTTSRSEEGRRAFLAYRRQKAIAQASDAKLQLLAELLEKHRRDRVLVFTHDNETVYRISRRFLVPAITHQTKVRERHETLERFNRGELPILVTSRVLNEGVDVPAASIGIVLSGTGSVREHVQRLGRILRRAKDKRATLYEVITEDTAEEFVSERRRRHSAYR